MSQVISRSDNPQARSPDAFPPPKKKVDVAFKTQAANAAACITVKTNKAVTYTLWGKKLHHFVSEITLSNLSLFE